MLIFQFFSYIQRPLTWEQDPESREQTTARRYEHNVNDEMDRVSQEIRELPGWADVVRNSW